MNLITWIVLAGSPAWAQDEPKPDSETTETTTEDSGSESSGTEAGGEKPAETPAPAPSSSTPDQAELDRAVELYNNGKLLFDEANYKDAITAWEESYRISKRPILLFNIASAYERLAKYDKAVEALNNYRAFAKADEKEALDRRVRNLEKLAEEMRKAEAERTTGPDEPAPEPVPPGRGQRVAGAALIGIGVVGIGAGAGLGLASQAAADAADDNCVSLDGSNLCLDAAKDDIDSNRSLATTADVALIGGIVAAGAGAVVLLTAPKATLTVGVSSVTFSGRF